MRKFTLLKIFVCFVITGLMAPRAEAAWPYAMTYTVSAGDTILAAHLNTSNNEHINNNIPESIDDYSNTVSEMGSTSDPYAGDTEVQATTLAGELQQLRFGQDLLKKKFNTSATKWYHDATDEGVLWTKGADVASANALPLLNDGLRVDVTGTTAITSMDTVGIGTVKCLQFDGALILTHHATDLVLPNGANITTIAEDRAWFHEYASGDWEMVGWAGHELAHTHADAANGGNTLIIPTIASFANATHDHSNAAGGGSIGVNNYRSGLNCKQASTITITVEAGTIEVDDTIVTKTSDTTLTLTTATDWVDDTSDQATSTYGYIYINAAGTIELDVIAPDASDPDDNTSGILRYNNTGTDTSWRRMIGWFFMNSTGAGELFDYEVGNLKDGDVHNSTVRTDSTQDVVNDNAYGTDLTNTQVHFYTSGRGVANVFGHVNGNVSASIEYSIILNDGSDIAATEAGTQPAGQTTTNIPSATFVHGERYAQGGVTFEMKAKVDAGTWTVEEKTISIAEN